MAFFLQMLNLKNYEVQKSLKFSIYVPYQKPLRKYNPHYYLNLPDNSLIKLLLKIQNEYPNKTQYKTFSLEHL